MTGMKKNRKKKRRFTFQVGKEKRCVELVSCCPSDEERQKRGGEKEERFLVDEGKSKDERKKKPGLLRSERNSRLPSLYNTSAILLLKSSK